MPELPLPSSATNLLSVQVVYAHADRQYIIPANVAQGSNIESAIVASKICQKCVEIDLSENKVGIFGCVLPLSHTLLDGDRVEIYRPLAMDPKKARIMRAKQ